jgi:DMSO reductase anchor subunit
VAKSGSRSLLITGVLLLKREAWGYALASLIFIKGITLGTGVLSMVVFMAMDGVEIVIPQVIAFVILTMGALALAVAFYGKMKTPATAGTTSA